MSIWRGERARQETIPIRLRAIAPVFDRAGQKLGVPPLLVKERKISPTTTLDLERYRPQHPSHPMATPAQPPTLSLTVEFGSVLRACPLHPLSLASS